MKYVPVLVRPVLILQLIVKVVSMGLIDKLLPVVYVKMDFMKILI